MYMLDIYYCLHLSSEWCNGMKRFDWKELLRLNSNRTLTVFKLTNFIMASFNKSLYYFPKETPVVRLICKSAFDNLSEVEKKYATMIAGASWKAALICLFQTSPESPLIFSLLRLAFDFMSSEAVKKFEQLQGACEVSTEAFDQAMAYIAGFFGNLGNYKSFGDTKIIPECSGAELEKIVMKAAEMSDNATACAELW